MATPGSDPIIQKSTGFNAAEPTQEQIHPVGELNDTAIESSTGCPARVISPAGRNPSGTSYASINSCTSPVLPGGDAHHQIVDDPGLAAPSHIGHLLDEIDRRLPIHLVG